MTLQYKTPRRVSRDIFSKQNAALAGAPPARLAVRQADGVSRIEKYRFSAWRRQHFSCQIEAKTPPGGYTLCSGVNNCHTRCCGGRAYCPWHAACIRRLRANDAACIVTFILFHCQYLTPQPIVYMYMYVYNI